jgi:hypothetical protein
MDRVKFNSYSLSLSVFVLAFVVSGCDTSPDQFFTQLGREWNALIVVLTGGSSPLAKRPASRSSLAAPSATPAVGRNLVPSQEAAHSKQNGELLQEVLRVVYDRDLKDSAQFGNLVDSMNQGASLEGLYNGFIHSSNYRKLEVANPGASPKALGFFANELARTEAELSVPAEFGPDSAQPLGETVQPSADSPGGVDEQTYGHGSASVTPSPSPSRVSISRLDGKYTVDFSGASIYTLKRVLGDEMLRLVDEKSKDPKALQTWYGAWVVRMCEKNVDFGLPLRNKADAAFHAQWAATADADHLLWEVLNRVHRVLNTKNDFPDSSSSVSGSGSKGLSQ